MLDINKIVENLNANAEGVEDKEQVIEILSMAGIELRVCTKCEMFMSEGYCFDEAGEYYCSDKCLLSEMTEEEYQEYYKQDVGYYTDWNN